MSLFQRKKHTVSLDDFHKYVEDISTMQAQRTTAFQQGQEEEASLLNANIEHALLVQERLLERIV